MIRKDFYRIFAAILMALVGTAGITTGVAAQTTASPGMQISTVVTAVFQAAPGGPDATTTSTPVGVEVLPVQKQPVYRLYDPFDSDHFYTINAAESQSAQQAGYYAEGVIGTAPAAATSGTASVYRLYCPASGDHFYTSSPGEAAVAGGLGYTYEGIAFQVLTAPGANTLPLYRFWWPAAGKHFYTTSQAERTAVLAAGFIGEGSIGFLYPGP